MVELQFVVLAVAGSNPVAHPMTPKSLAFVRGFLVALSRRDLDAKGGRGKGTFSPWRKY